MTGERIRVVLADDHTMFRQGLREMLLTGGDIEVVGEAENGRAALEEIRRHKPDVAILDVEMPEMDAREVLLRLPETSPQTRTVIVTVFAEARLARELVRLGARAYVTKSATLQELLAAVRSAARNTSGDNVFLAVPRGLIEGSGGTEGCELSERELEILLLVARGLSNRQVASELHLAEATVKRHLANVYAKLNVGSRGEAVRKALSKGWFTSHDVTRS
ncbi:Response regulator protein VraR [Rubrobacter xylanophilus DSM 9941]|uniref:response regulator transcription factor n=1 Tax=Rubrobacter xylanophilus TaxID=49319 RepID=UPI001C6424CC|nr:response regulator transcription factor [Rubrobacter xylanophilus]QYJ16898.1 Response regulator protein VraR [Rubrobacter xylanophilus DSM 9941]